MLDPKFIRDNLPAVKANLKNRNMNANPDAVVELSDERSITIQALDEKRQRRNEVASLMKSRLEPDARNALIEEGKSLKEEIAILEEKSRTVEEKLNAELMAIPNMAHPDAPVGKEESDNLEIKRVGNIPVFSFEPRDHVSIGSILDILDFDAGTKVSGTKFYFLKNEAVLLEMALIRYALDILLKKGFTAYSTPDIAKTAILEGIGFNPRGEESNVYNIEGEDLCLIGTAEITLGGYYAGQILDKKDLPIRMAGISHCFRREAGAAGQFSKGLYRVHQFTKLEMFAFCLPEQSEAMHEEMRLIEEEIWSGLGIPFRIVETCTGDLGAPAYRKWDLEAWMPGRNKGEWGEITSTSNCTDYQARRLAVRFRDDDGKNRHVHTLNGTAIAISRAIVSILENFQEEDGSIRIPPVLHPYMGVEKILPRKKLP